MEDNSQLFQIFKNTLLMMYRRGYEMSKFSKIFSRDLNYFNTVYDIEKILDKPNHTQQIFLDKDINRKSTRSMMSYIFKNSLKEKCLVYFAELGNTQTMPSTEVAIISHILNKEKDCFNVVIISPGDLHVGTANRIEELAATNIYKINIFFDKDMLYDPIFSLYSSNIEKIVPNKEAVEIVNDNKLTMNQIPKQASGDIISRYFGISNGSLVLYKRNSMISNSLIDENYYYRTIINRDLDKQKAKPKPKVKDEEK
uniref:RNA polymerase subunit H/Rpb5 C-terminal domain-containing protein n=1 Tax=viral metagenome TaxID=1070528 RepID=A0A6C0AEF4_9ZZZZ